MYSCPRLFIFSPSKASRSNSEERGSFGKKRKSALVSACYTFFTLVISYRHRARSRPHPRLPRQMVNEALLGRELLNNLPSAKKIDVSHHIPLEKVVKRMPGPRQTRPAGRQSTMWDMLNLSDLSIIFVTALPLFLPGALPWWNFWITDAVLASFIGTH